MERTRRDLARPALLVAAVLACAFGLVMAVLATRADAIDLQVYRGGGRAVLDGAPLYAGPVWGGLAFTYTPFAALLFTPLSFLSPGAATAGVAVLNSALLVGCAAACWRSALPGRRRGQVLLLAAATSGVLLATEALHTTLYLGQVNLLVLALALWDLLGRDGRRTVGIGIGIAAGIKLTPLLLVAFLLTGGRFRAAGTAVAAFAGTVVLGFLLLPGQSATYWLHGTFADSTRVYQDVASTHNQSLRGLLLRSGVPEQVAQLLWLAAAVAVAGGTFVVAARAARRGERLLAATLAGMCGATLSPWSWGHHWVWLLPLAVFLAGMAIRPGAGRSRVVWAAPAVLLPLTFPWVLALADPPDSTGEPAALGSGPLAFLLGNLYVLLFLVTLVTSALHLRRPAPVAVPRPRSAADPLPVPA